MGKTPFANACSVPVVNLDILRLLIKNGSQVDETDRIGYTPLIYVLHSPQYSFDTVKNLVENGARVDAMTSEGESCIHMIILSDNPEKWKCLDFLLKHGSSVNLQTNKKQTALHLSVLKNDIESAKILIRANADVNTVDRLGISPLSLAMCTGLTDFVHLLIDGGARLSIDEAIKCGLNFMQPEPRRLVAQRLMQPRSLMEISRVKFCEKFGPFTGDWLAENSDQFPSTLLPFLRFEN
jgi:ankyrin repeat protein